MSKKLKKLIQLAQLGERLPLPSQGRVPLNEPLDLVRAFVKAWKAGDADAIGNLFADDADFVNVVGLWWTSRTAIRKAHKYGFERIFRSSKLTVETVTERRLGDDVAVVHARWQVSGQVDPDGKPVDSRRGVISATVVRLEDGTWLCVSFQNTDIVPAADTFVVTEDGLAPASYLGGPSKADVAAAEWVESDG